VKKSTDEDGSFALVRRCLRILLTRESSEVVPYTYEAIYAACRSIVTVSKLGEGLYGTLKMELEQSVGRLASDLTVAVETGMNWIVEFVRVCQWFEIHVVRWQFESRDAADSVR
jgi:cullin-4